VGFSARLTKGTYAPGALAAGQWFRDNTPIAGSENADVYAFVAADAGRLISYRDNVTYSDGTTAVVSSNQLGPVINYATLPPSQRRVIFVRK